MYGLGFQNVLNIQINYFDNHFREHNKLTISFGVRDLLQSIQLGLDFALAPYMFETFGKSITSIFITVSCFNAFGLIFLMNFYYWYRGKYFPSVKIVESSCCKGKREEEKNNNEVEEGELLNPSIEYDMEELHEEKTLGICETFKKISVLSYLLIVTLACVGSGQLAVVGMAGNLLTKKFHLSDTHAGAIMGRYQLVVGITKPVVVIFTYFLGSRGWII